MKVSLQPNIDFVIRRIELQIQKLNQAIERFSQRDKSLFARVVEAVGKHDTVRAKVFANEVAEIRKMERLMLRSKIAMEQILSKVVVGFKIYNDVIPTLPAAARIMRTIAFQIESIFPESGMEIKEIRKTACILIVDAGEAIGSINFESAGKEASAVMAEVDKRADEEMKNRFPDLPSIEEVSPESHGSDEGST